MTAEEYLINRIQVLEAENDDLKEKNTGLREKYAAAEEIGCFLLKIFTGKNIDAKLEVDNEHLGDIIFFTSRAMICKKDNPEEFEKIKLILTEAGAFGEKGKEEEKNA